MFRRFSAWEAPLWRCTLGTIEIKHIYHVVLFSVSLLSMIEAQSHSVLRLCYNAFSLPIYLFSACKTGVAGYRTGDTIKLTVSVFEKQERPRKARPSHVVQNTTLIEPSLHFILKNNTEIAKARTYSRLFSFKTNAVKLKLRCSQRIILKFSKYVSNFSLLLELFFHQSSKLPVHKYFIIDNRRAKAQISRTKLTIKKLI